MNAESMNYDWMMYGTIIRIRTYDGTIKRVDPTKVQHVPGAMIIPHDALEDDEPAPVRARPDDV